MFPLCSVDVGEFVGAYGLTSVVARNRVATGSELNQCA
jgi:hypothetical protein